MKANRLFKPHPLLVRLVFHPHFQGAVIIAAIVLLLLFAGCSTHHPYRSSHSAFDDCEVLLKKRNSEARFTRQPKIRSGYSSYKKTGTITKATEVIAKGRNMIAPVIPTETVIASECSSEKETSKEKENGSVPVKNKSRKLLHSDPELKTLSELPKPASVFSKISSPDNSLLLYGLMLGSPLLVSLLILGTLTQTSMRVSAWGAHHAVTSKIILGSVHVGTGLTGLMTGSYLGDQQLFIPDELIASAAGAFIATSILYPTGQKSLGRFSSGYLKQKFCDALLFCTGIALFFSAGNQLSRPEKNINSLTYQGISEYRSMNDHVVQRDMERSKELQSDPVEKKNGKITLTILASLLFTVGILFVAALSCNLSCSGAGTGAVLVAVLGGGALILAFVAMLKNIKKKYKVKRKNPKESTALAF